MMMVVIMIVMIKMIIMMIVIIIVIYQVPSMWDQYIVCPDKTLQRV